METLYDKVLFGKADPAAPSGCSFCGRVSPRCLRLKTIVVCGWCLGVLPSVVSALRLTHGRDRRRR